MMSEIKTFLENDPHSREILHLVDALGLAFEKLAPMLSAEAGERFGAFVLAAQKDIARYLEGHTARTVEQINHAKNN